MSYSSSGAVATLWSPSNYNGATKIPVPSTTRRYSTTSSASTYRSSGSQERSYYSSTGSSYSSSSRNVQTEYRSRYSNPIRSSASVPMSCSSRLADLHDTTSKLTNKERSEANDNLLNYRRSSKTDSDVVATLEKYGLKTDNYRLRNDSMPKRFLNTTNIDSRYSGPRKLSGCSTLELSKLTSASSKPPKATLNSRLQRKDSLTKSETDESSSSLLSSLERKYSPSAVLGSSSPIETRKSETLSRTILKPIPGNSNSTVLKPLESNKENGTATGSKKRSPSDVIKKNLNLSPEIKDGSVPSSTKLPSIQFSETKSFLSEKKGNDSINAIDVKREARNASINSKLGLENRSDLKIQPKLKGEKLVTRIEQTLSKQPYLDNEILNSLSRLRKSPETKPKEVENQMKVIELRRIEANVVSPFEEERKKIKEDSKENSVDKKLEIASGKKIIAEKPSSKLGGSTVATQKTPKPPEKPSKGSLEKDVDDLSEGKELLPDPMMTKESSAALKDKDEKESQNFKEREWNKKCLLEEIAKDLKCGKKEDANTIGLTKEVPTWDKEDLSNVNNRPYAGQASTSHGSTCHSFGKKVENSSLTGSSPRSSLGRSRNSGGEKGGLNGLKNIGNTCFMNSVLQCLSNTKPLLEYLLNEDYLTDINFTISAMKGSLIKAFSNVIQELWAPNVEDRIINTTNFKSQIQKFAPRFMGYAQQDAQEFLRYLLEGLHEDVNRVTVKPQPNLADIDDSLSDNQKATEAWKRYLRMDDSKVVDIFVGQLKSTLRCTVCGHCSVTFDPFWDLSLPVPSRTGQPRLQSCLDAFTKEEVLDGEEKPTCSKCEMRRKCTKSFSIQKFPKILVLHLKRFSLTERYRGKLSITVDFPLVSLDLSPYAANKGEGCIYNLYAISNHSGSAYGGHYTAYCKHPYTGNWHEYNDSRVSSLSSRSVVSGEAYVLFYELATQTSHL